MKKKVFLLTLIVLFSCERKQKYSKELTNIFKAHGGVEVFKNVKTLSFSVDGKDVTIDLHSNKKVVIEQDFSFGFDGKEYWSSKNSPVINPQEHLEELSKIILIPFSLAEEKQTSFNKANTSLIFDDIQVSYNAQTNLIDIVSFENKEITYQEWEEVIGFKMPKKVKLDNKIIKFENLQLSQATFDDRFYQKPN